MRNATIPSGPTGRHDGLVSGPSADQPDLTMARASVRAAIAGSAMATPPRVRANYPLRPVAPEIEAKLAARARDEQLPGPAGRGRQGDLGKVVVPCAVLAVLDLIALVVAIATGHAVLAVVAGILFVPLAALAVIGAGIMRRSPAQLTLADRRAMVLASRWDSKQSWAGPLATCDERGLVIAAARVAERIAGSPGWRLDALGEHRVRLDLVAELDQIEDQAHRIALARQQHTGVPDPVLEQSWDALVDRVAALTAYADGLDGLAAARAAAISNLGGDPVRDSDLLAGSTRDQMALEQLYALSLFLNANDGDSFG
jgi:hypothetical protein